MQNDLASLNPKQQRAIVALLSEHSIPKAAEVAKVAPRTLYRWLAERKFDRAYRMARREAFGHAIGLAQRYAPLAVNTLAKIVADEKAPFPSRVQAAVAMLRFGREGIELDDLAARVADLEQAASDGASFGMAG